MKKTIKHLDGTEEVFEGTPEELAELQKRLAKENVKENKKSKKRLLNEELKQELRQIVADEIQKGRPWWFVPTIMPQLPTVPTFPPYVEPYYPDPIVSPQITWGDGIPPSTTSGFIVTAEAPLKFS